MSIQWRNELSIDRGFIDRDHKRLIDIINRFEQEIARGDGKSTLIHTLTDLKNYTREHFRREEEYQKEIEYPNAMRHASEHRELECQLDAVIQHFVTVAERGDVKPIAQEAAVLLRRWLVDHIIKSDLKLKEHMAKVRNLLSLAGRTR